jgi:glycosyltransferase involved in cell wall biosynthesis
MRRRRIVFLAAHLLNSSIASGGDVLFCEIAKRLASNRPDWDISVVAPDFCADALRVYFKNVVTFRTSRGEGRQGSPASAALTWARRVPKVTRLLTGLSPDHVHSTGDFFVDVLPALSAKKRLSATWTGNVHHINAVPYRRRNDAVVAAVSFALQRTSFYGLKRADAILLLNTAVKDQLTALGFSAERLFVVGAGIDLSRFPLIPQTPRSQRILWLNRLEPTKGIFDLPAIIRRLPPTSIVDVVGAGPQVFVDRLKRTLNEAGLGERYIVHGYVPHETLCEILAKTEVFISCSYEEGWGISIAEALASGVPCIVYDLPSHREIFDDVVTRVPLGDTNAFAEAICRQLREPENQERRAHRRAAVEYLSLDECAKRQENVFESLTVMMPAVSGLV